MKDDVESWLPLDEVAIRLRQIHYHRLDADGMMKLQLTDAYRMLLIIGGEGKCVIDGQWLPLQRGRCCLLRPGTYTAAGVSSGEGLAWYDLTFEAAPYEQKNLGTWGDISHGSKFWCAEVPDHSLAQAVDLAKRLYMDRGSEEHLARFRLNVVFQELLYWVMKDLGNETAGQTKERIARITDYMERHFQDNLSRDSLAEMAGMSPEYFSRMFRKETGRTLSEYLTSIRINHAKRELIRGEASIGWIAEYAGYGEQYYFSRKFKQEVGVSPTAYIEKQRNHVACLFPAYLDHMLAVGVTPYAAMFDKGHPLAAHLRRTIHLGEQEAELGDRHVSQLLQIEPDVILCSQYIDPKLDRQLNQIAPTFTVSYKQEWRLALNEVAGLLGKSALLEEVLLQYELKCKGAAKQIQASIGNQTVALLRIHADQIRLYGGSMHSYTAPVLYGDLGLQAPALVRKLAWNDYWTSLSVPLLLQLDADRLLLIIDPGCEAKARTLMSTRNWLEMTAVQNGNVYQADYYTWMSSGIMTNSLKIDEALRFLG
ncbi:helix-turn-helix domain-containing protein [Paenibacillus sp. HWE-109]|uniref:AraC family transcriptional regulator n=1 Tax=Paenibacillus sp. HWE-109 TaxID=1306526 RepID=UPI001EDF81B5|nr:helix-turn-helix domain-containing protein [Paenibacillus sp. HWE-109]UKS25318.1 helix-turn-helix domain-containing protein [Paenibacillus sp. HWE-109]